MSGRRGPWQFAEKAREAGIHYAELFPAGPVSQSARKASFSRARPSGDDNVVGSSHPSARSSF